MMLVVDASVVAEVLLGSSRAAGAVSAMGEHHLIAPHHLTAEVASVLRGWSLGGHLSEERALVAFEEFEQFGIDQIDMTGLLPTVFALRHNMTAYDALYVVLARVAGCRLLTFDRRLAGAAPDCAVVP